MKGHADHTACIAVASAEREWRNMARLALRIRKYRDMNPDWAEQQESRFTGIFKRLLTDPIESVEREAGR